MEGSDLLSLFLSFPQILIEGPNESFVVPIEKSLCASFSHRYIDWRGSDELWRLQSTDHKTPPHFSSKGNGIVVPNLVRIVHHINPGRKWCIHRRTTNHRMLLQSHRGIRFDTLEEYILVACHQTPPTSQTSQKASLSPSPSPSPIKKRGSSSSLLSTSSSTPSLLRASESLSSSQRPLKNTPKNSAISNSSFSTPTKSTPKPILLTTAQVPSPPSKSVSFSPPPGILFSSSLPLKSPQSVPNSPNESEQKSPKGPLCSFTFSEKEELLELNGLDTSPPQLSEEHHLEDGDLFCIEFYEGTHFLIRSALTGEYVCVKMRGGEREEREEEEEEENLEELEEEERREIEREREKKERKKREKREKRERKEQMAKGGEREKKEWSDSKEMAEEERMWSQSSFEEERGEKERRERERERSIRSHLCCEGKIVSSCHYFRFFVKASLYSPLRERYLSAIPIQKRVMAKRKAALTWELALIALVSPSSHTRIVVHGGKWRVVKSGKVGFSRKDAHGQSGFCVKWIPNSQLSFLRPNSPSLFTHFRRNPIYVGFTTLTNCRLLLKGQHLMAGNRDLSNSWGRDAVFELRFYEEPGGTSVERVRCHEWTKVPKNLSRSSDAIPLEKKHLSGSYRTNQEERTLSNSPSPRNLSSAARGSALEIGTRKHKERRALTVIKNQTDSNEPLKKELIPKWGVEPQESRFAQLSNTRSISPTSRSISPSQSPPQNALKSPLSARSTRDRLSPQIGQKCSPSRFSPISIPTSKRPLASPENDCLAFSPPNGRQHTGTGWGKTPNKSNSRARKRSFVGLSSPRSFAALAQNTTIGSENQKAGGTGYQKLAETAREDRHLDEVGFGTGRGREEGIVGDRGKDSKEIEERAIRSEIQSRKSGWTPEKKLSRTLSTSERQSQEGGLKKKTNLGGEKEKPPSEGYLRSNARGTKSQFQQFQQAQQSQQSHQSQQPQGQTISRSPSLMGGWILDSRFVKSTEIIISDGEGESDSATESESSEEEEEGGKKKRQLPISWRFEDSDGEEEAFPEKEEREEGEGGGGSEGEEEEQSYLRMKEFRRSMRKFSGKVLGDDALLAFEIEDRNQRWKQWDGEELLCKFDRVALVHRQTKSSRPDVQQTSTKVVFLLGKLYLTSYQMVFEPLSTLSNQRTQLGWSIPYSFIYSLTDVTQSIEGGEIGGIEICTKTGVTVRLCTTPLAPNEFKKTQLVELIQLRCFPATVKHAFVFRGTLLSGEREKGKERERKKEINGWDVYQIKKEYQRTGLLTKEKDSSGSAKFRLFLLNKKYEFCPTYPPYFMLPVGISDQELAQVSSFRSKARIPAVVWRHKSGSVIARCSQPRTGLKGKFCAEEEKLIRIIRESSPDSRYIHFFDARPKVNAMGNTLAGAGYEDADRYSPCKISFLKIENIHVVRNLLKVLISDLSNDHLEEQKTSSPPRKTRDGRMRGFASPKRLTKVQSSKTNRASRAHSQGLIHSNETRSSSPIANSFKHFDRTAERERVGERGERGREKGRERERERERESGREREEPEERGTSSPSKRRRYKRSESTSPRRERRERRERVSSRPTKSFFDRTLSIERGLGGGASFGGGGVTGGVTGSHGYGAGASAWLEQIRLLLKGAAKGACELLSGVSIVIHCSDGWDRTSQLCALVQLLLDPYYRTIDGFEVLIEKEFCSFGHKFLDRVGHFRHPSKKRKERSPIFLQFLDAVWQITEQYPTHFEFSESFLLLIAHHLYSCRFGTFLFNDAQTRQKKGVQTHSDSLWTYLNLIRIKSPQKILNENYNSSTMKKDDGVLWPALYRNSFKIWTHLFAPRLMAFPGGWL